MSNSEILPGNLTVVKSRKWGNLKEKAAHSTNNWKNLINDFLYCLCAFN
jgi:hypothetical protein